MKSKGLILVCVALFVSCTYFCVIANSISFGQSLGDCVNGFWQNSNKGNECKNMSTCVTATNCGRLGSSFTCTCGAGHDCRYYAILSSDLIPYGTCTYTGENNKQCDGCISNPQGNAQLVCSQRTHYEHGSTGNCFNSCPLKYIMFSPAGTHCTKTLTSWP